MIVATIRSLLATLSKSSITRQSSCHPVSESGQVGDRMTIEAKMTYSPSSDFGVYAEVVMYRVPTRRMLNSITTVFARRREAACRVCEQSW